MSAQFLAYFDPVGFSVLTSKERTTVEKDIKELLQDADVNPRNVHMNRTSQTNTTQVSTLPSTKSSKYNPFTKKSSFALFLDSVTTTKTKRNTVTTDTNQTNSSSDEFVLYKSLALKEVKRISEANLNPDASAFW